MYYKKGDIVNTSRRVGPYKKYDWLILEFLSYDVRKYKTDRLYSIEKYSALNMETGETKCIYIPVEFYQDHDDSETSYTTRKDVPDDSQQVCILFDDFEHWCKNIRQTKNKDLDKQNLLHQHRLRKIKEVLNSKISTGLRQGLSYHLIQKSSPTLMGLNQYNNWKQGNPKLYTELVKLIYENMHNTNISTNS